VSCVHCLVTLGGWTVFAPARGETKKFSKKLIKNFSQIDLRQDFHLREPESFYQVENERRMEKVSFRNLFLVCLNSRKVSRSLN